jgi:hypothetical protein
LWGARCSLLHHNAGRCSTDPVKSHAGYQDPRLINTAPPLASNCHIRPL